MENAGRRGITTAKCGDELNGDWCKDHFSPKNRIVARCRRGTARTGRNRKFSKIERERKKERRREKEREKERGRKRERERKKERRREIEREKER